MRSSCFNSLIVFGGHVVCCSLFRPFLNILEGLFSFYFLATLAPLLLISKFLYVSMLFLFFFFFFLFCFSFWRQQERIWRWESVFISVFGVDSMCVCLLLIEGAIIVAYYYLYYPDLF